MPQDPNKRVTSSSTVSTCSNFDSGTVLMFGRSAFTPWAFAFVCLPIFMPARSGSCCPGGAPKNRKRTKIERLLIEPHEHHAAARFCREKHVHVDLVDRGATERGLQLNVPNDRVRLKHQVVAAIVNLRLEHLEAPVASSPEMLHDLASEQVLEQGFSVRGPGTVRDVAHRGEFRHPVA